MKIKTRAKRLLVLLTIFSLVFSNTVIVFAQESERDDQEIIDSSDKESSQDEDQSEQINDIQIEEKSDELLEEESSPDSLLSEEGELVFRDGSNDVQKLLYQPSSNGVTGELNYEYPILVPSGRGKMTPDIRLKYSNQATNNSSIFGYGWSDNIPYIERQNKRGSDHLYSNYNFFSTLSGELASTTSTDYYSRIEDGSFYKYTFIDNAWTVKDKYGYKYKFGSTTAARQDNPASSTQVYKWMLEEVRDPNGNYIKYEYSKDSGQIYPYKIIYTGHGVVNGVFEVEFIKNLRGDIATSSKTSFNVVTRYRINEIQTKINGTWARKYSLEYSSGNNGARSILATSTEYGRDESGATTTSPAMSFNYQTSITSFTENSSLRSPIPLMSITSAIDGENDEGVRLVDINGDGLTDIVQSLLEGATTTSHAYINTGIGYQDNPTWYLPAPITLIDSIGGRRDPGTRLVDINGDNLIDLIQSYTQTDYAATTTHAYINNGNGFTDDPTWYPPTPFVEKYHIVLGGFTDTSTKLIDINGDGLVDIIRALDDFDTDINPIPIRESYINNGNGFTEDSTWDLPVGFLMHPPNTQPWGRIDMGVRLFDINGDGLIDIIQSYSHDGGTVRYSYINTGHGFTNDPLWELPLSFVYGSPSTPKEDLGVRVIDINDDGLPDLVKSFNNNNPNGPQETKKVHLNTGSGFSADNSDWYPPLFFYNTFFRNYRGVQISDLNGDGVSDFIQNLGNPFDPEEGISYAYINSSKKADVLTQVNLNTGGILKFAYKSSPQYLNGLTTTNPNLPLNMYTVEKITFGDGLGNYGTSTYSYAGGSFYYSSSTPFDRKFVGFASTTEADPVGNKTITYFHQGNGSDSSNGEYNDHISKSGRPYRIERKDSSDNLYTTEVSKWDRYSLGMGMDFIKLTQKTDLTYDGDGDHKDKAETYNYIDTNGNMVQKVSWGEVTASADGSFSDTGSDKLILSIAYATNTIPYILALPATTTVTNQSGSKVAESRFYYDAQSIGSVNKGNLTKEEKWKSGLSYASTTKTYDSYGLVTEERDPRYKLTTYAYDTHNLYPATSTNALSQNTTFWYDYSLGKPKQVKDPNGFIFQTIYDGFDRVLEEKQPDISSPASLVARTSYTYTDSVMPRIVHKTENLNGSTAHDVYTYVDGLGRTIQERKESESSYSVKDIVYNSLSLLSRESLPYFSSGSSQTSATSTSTLYINYSYDALKRIRSVVNAVGTTTNSYDDWKLSVTDPNGEAKHVYKDAYDRLIKVDEINGGSTYTTNYEYNGNNNLTKITDAESNIRNFTYDGLGRRIKAEDLHDSGDGVFGSTTYAYDDAGNLITQIDPKNQAVAFAYDDLNRLLTENYAGTGGTEISYGYDWCAGGVGKLCSATTTDSIAKNEYNLLGLLKKETKTIGADNYVTQFDYDRLGNQVSVIYPDDSEVRYTYNSGNLLEKVEQKENGGSFDEVVRDLDYSPNGKVAFKELGNGVTSTYTYDDTKLYRLINILTSAADSEAGGGLGFFSGPNLKQLFAKGLEYVSKPFKLLTFNGVGRLALEALDLVIPTEEQAVVEEESPIEEVISESEPVISAPVEVEETLQSILILEASSTIEAAIEIVPQEETEATTTTEIVEQVQATTTGEVLKVSTRTSLIRNTDDAKMWRDYHTERVEYLSSLKDLPESALESALYAKDKFEDNLLKKGYVNEKGAEIQMPTSEILDEISQIPNKIIKWVFGLLLPEKAYAYIFGKEDFESCSSLPCSFNVNDSWGGIAPSLDATSKVAGADSLKELVTGEGGGSLIKTGLSNTELWTQFKVYIPNPMNFGASGFASILVFTDGSDNPKIWLNVEDYGAPRLILDGNALAYTDTGLNLIPGAVNTIELRSKINNSTGDVDIWLNNSTQGSPSYNGSGSLNTGSGNIVKAFAGLNYVPESGYSTTYFDDVIVDTSFIGSGVTNTAPTAPSTLFAEGATNPTNISDNTPEFSAVYHDPNAGDLANKYRIQVATSSAFSTLFWDSGTTTMATTTAGSRSPDISYGGSSLASSTTYYWRIAFTDDDTAHGAWSTTTSTFSLASSTSTSTPSSFVNAVQNISYAYDALGNITSITDRSDSGAGKVLSFTYDDLHRLMFASTTAASSTPFKQTYAYSPIGNMTGLKTDASATSSYSYAETGYANPSAATSIGGTSLVYDNNGNVTSYGSKNYTWDYRNRMTASGQSGATTTYAYDHTEQRVKKVSGGVTTIYPNKYYNVESGDITKYIFAGDELVATVTDGTGGSGVEEIVYDDSTDWDSWSWDVTITEQSTEKVHDGTYAMKAVYSDPYGGVYLHTDSFIDSGDYDNLNLYINGGATGGQIPELELYDDSDVLIGNVEVNDYIPGGTIAANTWYEISIPLSDLGVSSDLLSGINIMNDTADTLYFDEIKFVAEGRSGTPVNYIHSDHLGSTNDVTDALGYVVQTLDYYPYGAERIDSGTDTSQRQYIGEMFDEETSMSYLNARYYQNDRGQFISQDPVHLAIGNTNKIKELTNKEQSYFLFDPQQLNSYSYARNNPLTNSDPKGLLAIGVGYGVSAEAGFGFFGAINLSGGLYLIADEETGDISYAFTITHGSNSGLQGVGNISYPDKAPKESGVVGGSASIGFSGTYMPNAKKPSDLAGISNNRSLTLPFVSFQTSNSNNQPSYTGGLGAKFIGSVSSYPSNTGVMNSGSIGNNQQLVKQLSSLVSSLQKLVNVLKSKK